MTVFVGQNPPEGSVDGDIFILQNDGALNFEEDDDEEDSPSIAHYYCSVCYPNGERSYCGFELEDGEDYDTEDCLAEDVDCVVCVDFETCPTCPTIICYIDETHDFNV